MFQVDLTEVGGTYIPIDLPHSSPDFGEKRLRYQTEVSGFTGTTVELYGRLSPNMSWIKVATITGSRLDLVDPYPMMAARLTVATPSGTPATDKVALAIAEAV